MIDIILTINNYDFLEDCENVIKNIEKNDIKYVRFNLSKISNIDLFMEKIKFFQAKLPKVKIIIDLPYPKSKNRLYFNHTSNIIKIKRNHEYNLLFKKNNSTYAEETLFINGINFEADIDEYVDRKVVIGDGEGEFLLKKINGKYFLKALNDFDLIYGKAIHLSSGSLKHNQMNFSKFNDINIYAIMLSFVESACEVLGVKKQVNNEDVLLLSKIETEKGIENLDDIIRASDGVVIARGDLYLYSNKSLFWKNEKHILSRTRKFQKKVYVATDVLDSLKYRELPSRADIIDVSFAIYNGATGFVLSAGKFSIEKALSVITEIEECK